MTFQGDVHKYRMSRWCTLFGEYPCPPEFEDPGSKKCLNKVRSMCDNTSKSQIGTPSSSMSSCSSSSSGLSKIIFYSVNYDIWKCQKCTCPTYNSFHFPIIGSPYKNSTWNKNDTCIVPYPIEILENGECRWKN